MTILCTICDSTIEVDEKAKLAELDPKYPAQSITITCMKCGSQLILQARANRGSSEAGS